MLGYVTDDVMQKLALLDSLDKKLLGQSLAQMYQRDRTAPAIFLLGTHEWGNIGDLAINYSEVAFLENTFPRRAVFPISRSALGANWQRIRATIGRHDIIAIHGGGNFGDIWPHEEVARRRIVEAFPHNAIISMPQSIHFGKESALAEAAKTYNGHKKLLLTVRDDKSFAIAEQHFPSAHVYRTEDIVTTYAFPFPFLSDAGDIIFVQRDDVEKRPESRIDAVKKAVEKKHIVRTTDTTVPGLEFVNTELAAKVVYRKIDELHSARVIVTDRLHGAVFALLAGRPVVVFENSYGKIGGALKNLLPRLQERIIFADGMDDARVVSEIERLRALPETDMTPSRVLRSEHAAFVSKLQTFTNLWS